MIHRGGGTWEPAIDAEAFSKRRDLGYRICKVIMYLNRQGRGIEALRLKESRYLDFICRYQADRFASPYGWVRLELLPKREPFATTRNAK